MKGTSAIRAVTFDAGGTLIEPWPSVGHVYSAVAAESGVGDFEPELLTHRFGAAWKAKGGFDYSCGAWRALVDATFEGLMSATHLETLFPVLYQRFAQVDVWRVFEDVLPTLRELRSAGFKLGLISNWDDRLSRLLDELGLMSYFDVIVISHSAGHTKPAPEIFRRAVGRFGLPPSAVLHIGDSLREDVEGARSAGLSARLLQRSGDSKEPGSIHSLRQTLTVIDRQL